MKRSQGQERPTLLGKGGLEGVEGVKSREQNSGDAVSAVSTANPNQDAILAPHRSNWFLNASKEEIIKTVPSGPNSFLTLLSQRGFEVAEGLVEVDESYLVYLRRERVVVVDVKNRSLLRMDGVDLSQMEHNEILDLSVDGDRWEGDVLQREPYGWGTLYDKEGMKVYEGFRLGSMNVCYGRSYYPDIAMVEYEGEIYEGKRCGNGVLYDRNGCVVYEGKWVDDDRFKSGMRTRVEISSSLFRIHNCVEELVVQDGCCNDSSWRTLDFQCMFALKLLNVGEKCFQNVDEVRLIGLPKLRGVTIGSNSFTKEKCGNDPNRRFYLKNCPKLKELRIGFGSFSDYTVCEIENVDALKAITVGDLNEWSYCFYHASLQLTSTSVTQES